jgi:hypothetical protein
MQFILEVPSAQFVSVYEPIYARDFPCYYSVSFPHTLLPDDARKLLKPKITNSLTGDTSRQGYGLIAATSQRQPLVIPLPGQWNAVQSALADADMCHLKRDLLLRGTPMKLNCYVYEYTSTEGSGHSLSLHSAQINGEAMQKRFEALIAEARSLQEPADCDSGGAL